MCGDVVGAGEGLVHDRPMASARAALIRLLSESGRLAVHWSPWPKTFESLRELPSEDASIDVVEPARLDTIEGDRCEVIEVEPLRRGHACRRLGRPRSGPDGSRRLGRSRRAAGPPDRPTAAERCASSAA
jgi:hypothetical protein